MASAFDPTRFLDAERVQQARVAAVCVTPRYSLDEQKTAEICDKPEPEGAISAAVAAVAGVAAPLISALPWEGELAGFLTMPCPDRLHPVRWAQLQEDAAFFSKEWGASALRYGWTLTDMFGCPTNPYSTAVDQLGLVPLLAGREIGAIDDSSALILNRQGPDNTFRLYPWRRPGVPIWVAYSQKGGP